MHNPRGNPGALPMVWKQCINWCLRTKISVGMMCISEILESWCINHGLEAMHQLISQNEDFWLLLLWCVCLKFWWWIWGCSDAMHVCMCVCVCVYIYIYIYIYQHPVIHSRNFHVGVSGVSDFQFEGFNKMKWGLINQPKKDHYYDNDAWLDEAPQTTWKNLMNDSRCGTSHDGILTQPNQRRNLGWRAHHGLDS